MPPAHQSHVGLNWRETRARAIYRSRGSLKIMSFHTMVCMSSFHLLNMYTEPCSEDLSPDYRSPYQEISRMDEEMLWIDSRQGACLRQEQRQTSFQIAPFQNRSPFAQEYSTSIKQECLNQYSWGLRQKRRERRANNYS